VSLDVIIAELKSERDRLEHAIEALAVVLPAASPHRTRRAKAKVSRRRMSAAARKRISIATKKRWADRKKKG
jgi:hypothetical protein